MGLGWGIRGNAAQPPAHATMGRLDLPQDDVVLFGSTWRGPRFLRPDVAALHLETIYSKAISAEVEA